MKIIKYLNEWKKVANDNRQSLDSLKKLRIMTNDN